MCWHGECQTFFGRTGAYVIIAQAVERRGDRDAALALFEEAVRLSPDNALVRYRRAKILIAMRRYRVSERGNFFVYLLYVIE